MPQTNNHWCIDFGVWGDGSPILHHPVLAALIFLIWQPEYSTESKHRWMDILRFYPLYLGVRIENEEAVQDVLSKIFAQARQTTALSWNGGTYTFRFRECTADHSAEQKIWLNKGGSAHRRCTDCSTDFSDHVACWSYAQVTSAFQKTLVSMAQLWNRPDAKQQANGVGLKSRPQHLPTSEELNDPDTLAWAEAFIKGQDNLHNVKGHLCTLIARLENENELFSKEAFRQLSEDIIQRRAPSDYDGSHWRELAARYQEVIMPAFITPDHDLKERYRTLFHHWNEVTKFPFSFYFIFFCFFVVFLFVFFPFSFSFFLFLSCFLFFFLLF